MAWANARSCRIDIADSEKDLLCEEKLGGADYPRCRCAALPF
jgi:hypothetical protein